MDSINILDDILSKSKGYEVALLTTFNFEIPFFERNVLYRFECNNTRYFSLFVDSNNYTEAINSISSSSIGKKYIVSEVETRASFHPKLILLLGEKKARLIVSSANLTFTGYCYNNEVFNVFDYDEDNTEYLSLIKDAYSYFSILNKQYNKLDALIFEKANEYNYLHRTSTNSDIKFISNYNKSIIDQINSMNLNIKQIDIAVPFYDNELNALNKLKELFNNAEINLYVQNRFSTFNFDYNSDKNIIDNDRIKIFDSFAEVGTPAIYHGKVFRFITDDESYVLYGSANCTEAALFKSSEENGNFECDVLAKGSKNEFDYFFNNFIEVKEKSEISNRIISYSSSKKYNFKHIPQNDKETLLIKYKEKWENLHIYINDKEYKYDYDEGLLIIKLDEDVPYGIISIDFIADGNKETINAYLVLSNVINEYRTSSNKDLSVTLDKINNSKSIEYIKYYKMLLDLVPYDTESLKEYKDNNDIYREAVSQKESEDDFDDEFVVDFDIPDEVLNKQKEYNKIESIKRGIIANFVTVVISGKPGGIRKPRIKKPDSGEDDTKVEHNVLPEEDRFNRYIKRLFKGVLDTRYLEECSLKTYIDNILLLIKVICTYNSENSTEAFNINEYNNLLLDFFKIIQKKDFSKLDSDIIELLKILLFVTLIQISTDPTIQNKAMTEVICRNVLLSYDKTFELRNNYKEYFEKSISLLGEELNYEECENNIERLFNYKNEEDLYNDIRNKIKVVNSIEKNGSVLVIEVHTTEIVKYMNVQNLVFVFNEVKNRYRQTQEVNQLLVNIINENIDISSPNPIIAVRYIYNINSSMVERSFKNKNDSDYRIVGIERI